MSFRFIFALLLLSLAASFAHAQAITGLTHDCTATGPGNVPITCTKSGGVPFAPSATIDATNASNITTGALTLPTINNVLYVAPPTGVTATDQANITTGILSLNASGGFAKLVIPPGAYAGGDCSFPPITASDVAIEGSGNYATKINCTSAGTSGDTTGYTYGGTVFQTVGSNNTVALEISRIYIYYTSGISNLTNPTIDIDGGANVAIDHVYAYNAAWFERVGATTNVDRMSNTFIGAQALRLDLNFDVIQLVHASNITFNNFQLSGASGLSGSGSAIDLASQGYIDTVYIINGGIQAATPATIANGLSLNATSGHVYNVFVNSIVIDHTSNAGVSVTQTHAYNIRNIEIDNLRTTADAGNNVFISRTNVGSGGGVFSSFKFIGGRLIETANVSPIVTSSDAPSAVEVGFFGVSFICGPSTTWSSAIQFGTRVQVVGSAILPAQTTCSVSYAAQPTASVDIWSFVGNDFSITSNPILNYGSFPPAAGNLIVGNTGLSDFNPGSNPYSNFVLLTNSGSWSAPPQVSQVSVCLQAAGGGGGGTGNAASAGGGGSSGENKCALLGIVPGGTVTYTNSPGGAGGAGGGANGSTGGNATFGSLTAGGGRGGAGSTSGSAVDPTFQQVQSVIVPTAAASNAQIASDVVFGPAVTASSTAGGVGGSSPWEIGGAGGSNSNGLSAPTGAGQCGGGGGGGSNTATLSRRGGAGGPSCIAIRW